MNIKDYFGVWSVAFSLFLLAGIFIFFSNSEVIVASIVPWVIYYFPEITQGWLIIGLVLLGTILVDRIISLKDPE